MGQEDVSILIDEEYRNHPPQDDSKHRRIRINPVSLNLCIISFSFVLLPLFLLALEYDAISRVPAHGLGTFWMLVGLAISASLGALCSNHRPRLVIFLWTCTIALLSCSTVFLLRSVMALEAYYLILMTALYAATVLFTGVFAAHILDLEYFIQRLMIYLSN